MSHLHIGCLLDRLPGLKIAEKLTFFELLPRPPIPKYGTFARFRKAMPPSLEVSLVAPRSTWSTPRGPMRPGPELDQGVAWLSRASDALGACAVVIETHAELTPGARDRSLTEAFFERLRPLGKRLVFAPGGLWEPEQAAPFAEKLGALYGFDPLEHEAPAALNGAAVYARIRPMGVRARLAEGHLALAAERLLAVHAEHVYVSIASERGLRDAVRMMAAMHQAGELMGPEGEEPEEAGEDEQDEDDQDEQDGDPALGWGDDADDDG